MCVFNGKRKFHKISYFDYYTKKKKLKAVTQRAQRIHKGSQRKRSINNIYHYP
jgi:hypothetical protein